MSDHEWTVEVTATAQRAISREVRGRWDGRELGGLLVGHIDGERIVVTDANGLETGVETPPSLDQAAPSATRWCAGGRQTAAQEVLSD